MKWPPLKSHLSLRLIIGVYSNIFHEFLLSPFQILRMKLWTAEMVPTLLSLNSKEEIVHKVHKGMFNTST
jgi:hypothetical protein